MRWIERLTRIFVPIGWITLVIDTASIALAALQGHWIIAAIFFALALILLAVLLWQPSWIKWRDDK
jgi:hypothetical protein